MEGSRSCPSANAASFKPASACSSSFSPCCCFRFYVRTGKTAAPKHTNSPPQRRQLEKKYLLKGIKLDRCAGLAFYIGVLFQLLSLRNSDDDLARPRQSQIVARDFLDQSRIALQISHFMLQLFMLLVQLIEIRLHLLNLALRAPHRQKTVRPKN